MVALDLGLVPYRSHDHPNAYQDSLYGEHGMTGVRSIGALQAKTPKRNPTDDLKRAAVGKYKEFWAMEPTKIGDFPSSFKIPARARDLGKSVHVLYDSLKKDPETLKKPKKPVSYIHEHDAGVHTYACDGQADTDVPDFIKGAQALVLLGQCVGFAYKDDEGDVREAQATEPLPDLYCTPDGRALLVIQSRRKVLAMTWGGALGVEARGIVG